MKYRKCSKCGITQELDNFWYQAKDKDKHQWYCKECDVEYHREHKKEMRVLLKYDELILGIRNPVMPKRPYRTTTPLQVSIRS